MICKLTVLVRNPILSDLQAEDEKNSSLGLIRKCAEGSELQTGKNNVKFNVPVVIILYSA